MRTHTTLLASLALATLCCSGSEGREGVFSFVDASTGSPAILVPASADIWGRPHEVVADGRGRLYITDADGRINVVSESGEPLSTIGQPGAGPGELARPRSTRILGDSVVTVNSGNGRIEIFDPTGSVVATRILPAAAISGAVDVGQNGTVLISRNGRDGSLATFFPSADSIGIQLGEAVVEAPEFFDMTAMKTEIANHRVPPALRNAVLPVLAPDGGAWLILVAEARVQRFTSGGDMLWDVPLEGPGLALIIEEFFKANEGLPPNTVRSLSYVTDAKVIEDNLWLLLRMPEGTGTIIQVLGPDGRFLARLSTADADGIRAFALGSDSQTLFLLDYDDAALLSVQLPLSFHALVGASQ